MADSTPLEERDASSASRSKSESHTTPPSYASALSYDRTVDRREVQRCALSEVFLTDFAQSDSGKYVAAALLPTSHACFGDHIRVPQAVDTLLLLECCRQAVICASHRVLGQALESTSQVTDWTFQLVAPAGGEPPPDEALASQRDPVQMAIRLAIASRDQTQGSVAADFVLDAWHGTRPVAHGKISARFVPTELAESFRLYYQPKRWITSHELPRTQARPSPVLPAQVARHNPANVVLTDARLRPAGVTAVLGVIPDHPTYFDDPTDHYPAMVLMEAARQAALLHSGPDGRVLAYRASLYQLADVGSAVRVVTSGPRGRAAARGGQPEIAVRFMQHGVELSEVHVKVDVAERASAPSSGDKRPPIDGPPTA